MTLTIISACGEHGVGVGQDRGALRDVVGVGDRRALARALLDEDLVAVLASSRTPDGVSATRYSSVLISVGTPTFMGVLSVSGGGGGVDELAAAQGEPELDAVARD